MFAKANNDKKFMFISGVPHKILFSWILFASSSASQFLVIHGHYRYR